MNSVWQKRKDEDKYRLRMPMKMENISGKKESLKKIYKILFNKKRLTKEDLTKNTKE